MMRLTLYKKNIVFSWTILALSLFACVTVSAWQYNGGDNGSSSTLEEGSGCRIKTGEPGICTRIDACEPYYEQLKTKQIAYSFLVRCSFIGTTEIICCPQAQPTPNPTSTDSQRSVQQKVTASTMSPIVVGDKTVTGNEPFIDLSKILTPRRDRKNNLVSGQGDKRSADVSKVLNPWSSERKNIGNNVRWPDNRDQQGQFINQQNRRPEKIRPTINPDVDIFDSSALNNQGSTSSNLVQFPSQKQPSIRPQSSDSNIMQIIDPFEAFKFRPSSNEDIETTTTPIGEWSWSRPATTERVIRKTTTTERTPVQTTPLLTDWMKDALTARPIPTSRTTEKPSSTPVAENSFIINPSPRTPVETVTVRNGNERPSQAACREYMAFNPASLTFHILDGVPVAPGEYPHMGGLLYPSGAGSNVDLRCGSSLISKRYVLTAAHCVVDPLALPTAVRLGVVEWNSSDEDIVPLDVEIENITLHSEYLSHLRYHDVALIRLRNDVQFTPFIRPACLYADVGDIDSSIPLSVTGWGVTNVQTRARSEILLQTNVTTVGLQECNATHIAYGPSRSYRTGLNAGHYCAFDPELKKDACQSDSGGPLNLVRNNQSTIVGIVSFGLSCGSSVPSVYARVAYYLDWIESIVWPS